MLESDGLGSTQPLLIERDAEGAALESVLGSARGGRRSVLLLDGPPGIGANVTRPDIAHKHVADRHADRPARVCGHTGILELAPTVSHCADGTAEPAHRSELA